MDALQDRRLAFFLPFLSGLTTGTVIIAGSQPGATAVMRAGGLGVMLALMLLTVFVVKRQADASADDGAEGTLGCS